MKRTRIILCLFCLFFVAQPASSQVSVPELWGTYVHDQGNILSPEFEQVLDQRLRAYEDSTSNQVVVLIVQTLNGVPMEDYTFRVAEKSKIGQADKDNGVLLFVATGDQKIRIEVGEGLEGPLPDAVCSQIIRNEIAPRFRERDYEGGIAAAITAITAVIGGEYEASSQPPERGGRTRSLWGVIAVLVIIVLISRISGGGTRRGGWSSGRGWYMGGFGRGSRGGRGGGFSGGGGGFSGGGASGSW